MNKICSFICAVFNWLPIFHVSADSYFGSFKDSLDLRFSLLVLPWGIKKYYLLTYSKQTGWNWRYTLRLNSKFEEEQANIDRKAADFAEYIKEQEQSELLVQIDCLRDMISDKYASSSILNNKVNLYTSILLVFLGFWFYLLGEVVKLKTTVFPVQLSTILLLFLSGGYLLNYLLFILYTLNIKSSVRSMFAAVKEKPDDYQFAKNKYLDWFSLKANVTHLASVVGNIEKYFRRGLFTSFLVWLILFANVNITSNGKPPAHNREFIVFNQAGLFMPVEFAGFTSELSDLHRDKSIYLIATANSRESRLVRAFLEGILKNKTRLKTIELENGILNEKIVILKFGD